MKCIGCGSSSHFFKECGDPKKHENRIKRLEEIAKLKGSKHKRELRSYFTQLEGLQSDSREKESFYDVNASLSLHTSWCSMYARIY